MALDLDSSYYEIRVEVMFWVYSKWDFNDCLYQSCEPQL